jgi:AraC-like DNA-binding protein
MRPVRLFRCWTPGVRAVEASSRQTFARHTHDEFGIGVIRRGGQRSASGRGQVEAGPGDVITVNPGEVHDGAPVGDRGRAWRILYFDPPLIADAVQDISEGRAGAREFADPVVRTPGVAAGVERLFSAMTAERPAPEILKEGLLLGVLAKVMLAVDPADRRPSAPGAIREAIALIDDEPSAPVALADLARASGLSRFQVLRGFVRATGLTPHAYLIQRRTDAARRLIAAGAGLAEAAAACGFSDQSHMTRLFGRKYGLTPGDCARAGA